MLSGSCKRHPIASCLIHVVRYRVFRLRWDERRRRLGRVSARLPGLRLIVKRTCLNGHLYRNRRRGIQINKVQLMFFLARIPCGRRFVRFAAIHAGRTRADVGVCTTLWYHADVVGNAEDNAASRRTELAELAELDPTDLAHFTPKQVGDLWSATMTMQREAYTAYHSHHVQQSQQERSEFLEAETTCPAFNQFNPAQSQDDPDQSAHFTCH